MIPRPSRLVAIARRDLRMELAGRRGLGLPLVIAGLLLPISSAPTFGLPVTEGPPVLPVSGDLPPEIARLEGTFRTDPGPGSTTFEAGPPLKVHGPLPAPIREALDAEDPAPVAIAHRSRPIPLPQRTLLFALISASTLTGAVSASIGGERQARTLVALLSAAVTRAEVVLGKWLAWGGLGVTSAVTAMAVALALGRVEPGWWILPMITVPLCAVALSLWLVRSATDVIGGTTVTLRVVPAVIGTAGLVAWFVGIDDPLLGAAIPLGGALVAAGATWGPGAMPALIAAGSTAIATAALLAHTASDLDESIGTPGPTSPRGAAMRTAAVAALCWWPPLLGPLLWGTAGNPGLTESLPRGPGALASGLGLVLVFAVARARETTPQPLPGPQWPSARGLLGSALAGAVLGLIAVGPLTPLPESLGDVQLRLGAALTPGWAGLGPVLAVSLGTELLFRGWLTARSGERWALWAWVAVCAPLDPLGGLVSGLVLAAVARRAGVWGSVLAHAAWAGVGVAVISLW